MNETQNPETPQLERFGSLDMTKLRTEHSRTYIYADGGELHIENVTHLHVKRSDEGHSHRLRDANGDMWYVAPGWVAIKFPGLQAWTL